MHTTKNNTTRNYMATLYQLELSSVILLSVSIIISFPYLLSNNISATKMYCTPLVLLFIAPLMVSLINIDLLFDFISYCHSLHVLFTQSFLFSIIANRDTISCGVPIQIVICLSTTSRSVRPLLHSLSDAPIPATRPSARRHLQYTSYCRLSHPSQPMLLELRSRRSLIQHPGQILTFTMAWETLTTTSINPQRPPPSPDPGLPLWSRRLDLMSPL